MFHSNWVISDYHSFVWQFVRFSQGNSNCQTNERKQKQQEPAVIQLQGDSKAMHQIIYHSEAIYAGLQSKNLLALHDAQKNDVSDANPVSLTPGGPDLLAGPFALAT